MSESKLLQRARRRSRDQLQALASEMRALREDAGISQRAVAHAAGLAQSSLSGIEGGQTEPSLETLGRLAAVLGCDLSVRLFPNTGPAIRDRFQARIVEALIGAGSRVDRKAGTIMGKLSSPAARSAGDIISTQYVRELG